MKKAMKQLKRAMSKPANSLEFRDKFLEAFKESRDNFYKNKNIDKRKNLTKKNYEAVAVDALFNLIFK